MNNLAIVNLVPDTPYNRIMSFLDQYQENTRKSYLKYYKIMFMYMTGKTLEQLTYQDIKSINDIKVEQFRNHLKTQYANTSINQIIFACKALYDRFRERRIVEINDFDISPLTEKENKYGSLTSKEMENLYNYCLKQDYKPMTLKLYFEFLYTVTCRKSAAQNLTWDNINRELDIESGQMVWVITFMDKGKEIKKAIQDDFYNRLKENYTKEKEYTGKIFNIHNHTIDKVLKGFCQEYGISEKRNITQHSIKSSGLDIIQNITGDINITASAAQHKNIQTTYARYLNKNKQYTLQPSYFLGKEFTIDTLRELDKDTLLKLIERAGKETIIKLNLELEKLK